LIRDVWPGGIGRWPLDLAEKDEMEDWEVVPRGLENIAQWGQIAPHLSSRDLSRQHLFVHVDEDDGSLSADDSRDLYQITVRLQGVLGAHNLATLGNWDGTEKNACKAMQFLTIEPGPFEDMFSQQRSSLNELQECILKRLGCRVDRCVQARSPGPIYCSRRVFTRVAGMEDAPDSILNASEDPQRLASAIASRWRVIEKTTFGCRTSGTEGRECNSIVFSKGDFVDVAVTFDI
ncbi:hypothetical protein FA95DRAFT_1469911, partial [Auriscalpium vulgare]